MKEFNKGIATVLKLAICVITINTTNVDAAITGKRYYDTYGKLKGIFLKFVPGTIIAQVGFGASQYALGHIKF